LQGMPHTITSESKIAKRFGAEAVNTTCYFQNIIYIRLIPNKTTYK